MISKIFHGIRIEESEELCLEITFYHKGLSKQGFQNLYSDMCSGYKADKFCFCEEIEHVRRHTIVTVRINKNRLVDSDRKNVKSLYHEVYKEIERIEKLKMDVIRYTG